MPAKHGQIRVDPDIYKRILNRVKSHNPMRLSINRMANCLLESALEEREAQKEPTTAKKEK